MLGRIDERVKDKRDSKREIVIDVTFTFFKILFVKEAGKREDVPQV